MLTRRLILGGILMAAGAFGKTFLSSPRQAPVVMVQAGDAELEAARREAQRTLPQFIAALEHPGPKQKKFMVKVRFQDGSAVEYIWLNHVAHSDGVFSGVVDNHPNLVKNVQFGQKVQAADEDVTDWVYFDDGKLRGGFSIQALLDRQARKAKQGEPRRREP